jgi:hypothetical protein
VTVLLYGQWPAGVGFMANAKPDHTPVTFVDLVVLKGRVELDTGTNAYELKAPPGPALFEWASNIASAGPRRIEKLPAWTNVEKTQSEEAKIRLAMLAKVRAAVLAKKPLGEIIDGLIASGNEREQRLGLVIAGATDDLVRLGNAMSAAKDAATWDWGIRVARHWLGRGPGQDAILYDLLQKERGFKKGEATIILSLLHDFSDFERTCPECYETLIEYLKSKNPAIRNLAAWHLYRLVPTAAKDMAFKPNASPEEAEKLYQDWKKLIPAGKMPPKPKAEEPKK